MSETLYTQHHPCMPVDSGEISREHQIEVAFVGHDDLSALTPRRLADYHVAVTAVQLDGHDVFLDELVREQAESCIGQTEQELLVAAGDAITRELLPGGMTGSRPTGGEHVGSVSDRKEVAEFLSDEAVIRRYGRYVGDEEWSGLWQLVQNRYVAKDLGEPTMRTVLAMRRRLESVRDDRQSTVEAVDDIARFSRLVFGSLSSDANKAVHVEVQKPQHGVARRIAGLLLDKLRVNRVATPQASEAPIAAPAPERGWYAFSRYVHDLCGAMRSSDHNAQVIMANRVIGGAHDNGPILERFTQEGPKADEYLAVLDATMGSYGQLAERGGYLSLSLLGYMTGRQKSLHAVPQGKAVPPQFTGLTG